MDERVFQQRRRARNAMLGWILAAFVMLIFAVSVVKLGGLPA